MSYDASNIHVLKEHDMANPMFDWVLIDALSVKYNRDKEWIARSIAACREAGVSPKYFIDRYLERTGSPLNIDVDTTSRSIQHP